MSQPIDPYQKFHVTETGPYGLWQFGIWNQTKFQYLFRSPGAWIFDHTSPRNFFGIVRFQWGQSIWVGFQK